MASNWLLIPDKRDKNFVLQHYITKGRLFQDPRRPDLTKYFVQKTGRRTDLTRRDTKSYKTHTKIAKTSYASHGYISIIIHKCEFFISRLGDGRIDLSDVHYREDGCGETKRPRYKGSTPRETAQIYHKLEITQTDPGDLLKGKKPNLTVLRTYFIRIATESHEPLLDLMNVYCIDGVHKTVEKCQPKVLAPRASNPLLRFLMNGLLLLDDDMIAPSFFELNEEWQAEEAINIEINARAKRTNRYIKMKLRRELQMDNMDWQGRNLGYGVEKIPMGGDHARHLEALGQYRSGSTSGYGDVWVDRPQEDLDDYNLRNEQEERLIEIAKLKDPWRDLEKMICGQETHNPMQFNECQTFDLGSHHLQALEQLEEERVAIANYDEYEIESELDLRDDVEVEDGGT